MEKIDELEGSSEQIREIFEKTPPFILKWGITIIFVVVGIIFYCTWLIKYPDIIQSQVIVTSQVPPQKELAKTNGKLSSILVKDGQNVAKGQVLAVIENTARYNDVYTLKRIVDTTRINNTFYFPIDSMSDLLLGEIESYYAVFENNYIQYQLNKSLDPFLNEKNANEYAIRELKSRLFTLKSQKEIYRTELQLKEKYLNRNKALFEEGVLSAQEFEDIQYEYAQAERNYKNTEVAVSQVNELLVGADKNAKGTDINRKKQEIILLKSVIQSFNDLKRSIRNWEISYVLRAQIEGRVSFLNVWDENQSVKPGDLVFTIVPREEAQLIAKLKTPIQNSGRIKLGQRVNIKLSNYPYQEFGVLRGKVDNISLTPDENGLYSIDVWLPKHLVTSYNKEIQFRQEMSGTGEIVTEDLRLIERVFNSFRKILTQ